ncbi:MAG: DNA primase [Chitinophagaceae bacterium]|nr:DNA primase [Chitinophagaceae bacterium]
MITRSTIQKVNDTADIIDVVGSFVKLKKRGVNYLGNCPFHHEKTPSFTVSPSKGIYKCFGCGKAGNVITFVQEHEKLTYPETIVWLAKRYNIEVEETEVSNEAREKMQLEESLRIVNQYASNYFTQKLFETEEGKLIGMSYFKQRGFREETIKKFQLGYCLEDKLALPSEALSKGYNKEILIKAGLVSERYDQLQSIYSGRVIFPIHNQSGKIIGFGARTLKTSDKTPKYINTPENEIYLKSKTLYGIYFSRNAITKENSCLLVEGYTDVISLHQNGVEHVVASSGTSLTEDQLKLIKRYTKNLVILYDGDAAGIKAALRGLDMAIEQGLNVQVVLLPNNHDPDSYVQEVGAEGFKNYIQENKKDIILFKLEASLKEANNDTIKKTELINDIAETLSKINKLEEFTKQQDYIRRCSQLLQIEEAGLISLVNKKIREKAVKQDRFPREEAEALAKQAEPEVIPDQSEVTSLLQKDYAQEKALIKILLEYGNRPFDEQVSVADYIRVKIADGDFMNTCWQKIYTTYFNHLDETLVYPEEKIFTAHEDNAIRSYSIEALYFPYVVDKWEERHTIPVPDRESLYVEEVEKTVLFFILRKIKTQLTLWLDDIALNEKSDHEEMLEEDRILKLAYTELKKNELELLKQLRTVLIR